MRVGLVLLETGVSSVLSGKFAGTRGSNAEVARTKKKFKTSSRCRQVAGLFASFTYEFVHVLWRLTRMKGDSSRQPKMPGALSFGNHSN